MSTRFESWTDLRWSIELEPGDALTLIVAYEDGRVFTGHGRYTGRARIFPVNDFESVSVPDIVSDDLPEGRVKILRWAEL